MLYNGTRKAKCKLCRKLISAANTTNLRSHVNSVHKKEVEQTMLEDEKVSSAVGLHYSCFSYILDTLAVDYHEF